MPSLCGRIYEHTWKAHHSKSEQKNLLIYILIGNFLLDIKKQIQDSEGGCEGHSIEVIIV